MIYLVTRQQQLFESPNYALMTVEESLNEMSSWKLVQLDTETTGRNPHLCNLLCVQFGNDKADKRIVVDCTTVDIKKYKGIIEEKLLIGQNLKIKFQL